MSFTPVSGTPPQYSTLNNELATDYWIKFYAANTANGINCATDATGGTLLAKVKLSTSGYPISDPLDNDTVFIPHIDQDYRIVLYTSEADADADNTANAAFNINPLTAGAAVTQPSSSVTLRDTTLQASDDYDRSPLFVDGTDFTAGAPPHVITTPAGWNPGAASTRFWKRSADGTIQSAIISAQTSTTFTVNESLLSTDTIFIGDDENRNIHDGDPLDIRTRLGVETQVSAEAKYLQTSNELQEIEDAGSVSQSNARNNIGVLSETVSGFDECHSVYIKNDSLDFTQFDVDANLADNTLESIGATGSGADNIWADLDSIPSGSKGLILRFYAGVSATGIKNATVFAKKTGSVVTDNNFHTRVCIGSINNGVSSPGISEIIVPVDSNGRFSVRWLSGGAGTSPVYDIFIMLRGYIK